MPSILEGLLADLDEATESAPASTSARRTVLAEPAAAPAPSVPAPARRGRKASAKGAASAAEVIKTALEHLEPGETSGPAETTEAAPAPKAKLEPIMRPGGQLYHPRQLAGKPDVQALRALRSEGIPVLLSGYPGCGKTALVEAAFADEGGPLTFAGHGEAEIGDLVGSYVQRPDGSFHWQHGPLPLAMLEGRPLFVDDATLTSPGVLARLYPAMDGRGVITLTEHEGEQIVAREGFYVIAAHNPGVPGAVLSEALASRFSIHLEIPTDLSLAVDLGVERPVVSVAKSMQAKRSKGEVLWAPEMRELLAYSRIKKILGRKAALENLMSICPEADREVLAPLLTKHLTDVKPLTLEGA